MNSTYAYNRIMERARQEGHNFGYIINKDLSPLELDLYDIFNINLTDTETFESPNCVMIQRAVAIWMPNQNDSNPNWDYYTDMCNMRKGLPKPQYVAIEDGYVVGMVWCDFEGEKLLDITKEELAEVIPYIKENADKRDKAKGFDELPLNIRLATQSDCDRYELDEIDAIFEAIRKSPRSWDAEFMYNDPKENYSDSNDCGIYCMNINGQIPLIKVYW